MIVVGWNIFDKCFAEKNYNEYLALMKKHEIKCPNCSKRLNLKELSWKYSHEYDIDRSFLCSHCGITSDWISCDMAFMSYIPTDWELFELYTPPICVAWGKCREIKDDEYYFTW